MCWMQQTSLSKHLIMSVFISGIFWLHIQCNWWYTSSKMSEKYLVLSTLLNIHNRVYIVEETPLLQCINITNFNRCEILLWKCSLLSSHDRDTNYSTEFCSLPSWKNLRWRECYYHGKLDATTKLWAVWYWSLQLECIFNIWYTASITSRKWWQYHRSAYCEWESQQCAAKHYLHCHHHCH